MIDINKLSFCTGCTACKHICSQGCISMNRTENGFLYPAINDISKCIECGLCEKICPVINEVTVSNMSSKAFAAYSNNEVMRLNSSSGGLFSEIANLILNENGIIVGAVYNEDFSVSHRCITTTDELSSLRGAKYSQSDLGDVFVSVKRYLKEERWVLFSGTPCQVAGLKSYLRKDYEKLICVDFVCHSVPSPLVWKKYVNYRAEKDNNGQLPIAINLRSKHTGWSHYRYSNLYQYADGKTYTALSGDDIFMKLFVGNYINRNSCADCRFKGYERVSDITLADFWGIWDIDSEMDDDKGTSLVLVHSEKGKKLMEDIRETVIIKKVTLEEASRQNLSMLRSSKANDKAAIIFRLAKDGKFDEIEKKYLVSNKRFLISQIKNKLLAYLKR